MTAVPAEPPVTTPVADPTEAIPAELLVQVPPPDVLDSVVERLPHTLLLPEIALGFELTVTVCTAAAQPVVKE
jgi:hypothetical protein